MDNMRRNGLFSLVLVAAVLLPLSTALRANPHPPIILRAQPDPETGLLVISGENFGSTPDSVFLGGTTLGVQSWTSGEIVADLPPGITSGTYLLTVFAGKGSSHDDMAVTIGDQLAANHFVVGSISGLPNLALDQPMPMLVGATSSNTVVVASGWGSYGAALAPISIQAQVTSPNTIHFTVYDNNGAPYDPGAWTFIEIRYAAFLSE